MTVENTNSTISYTGNNSVTVFAYDFLSYSASHLSIYLDDDQQFIGFTISGIGEDAGGNITFDVAPGSGVDVRIDRTVPETQLIEYQEFGPFPAKTNERALDLAVMGNQQLARDVARNSSKKMDKQLLAVEDNIIIFDDEGNSKDSGFAISDIDGFTPVEQPRQAGDNIQTQFDTPADVSASPFEFQVRVDGLRLRGQTDYNTNTVGKIDFTAAPSNSSEIDITWYKPLLGVDSVSLINDLSQAYEFDTLADATSFEGLVDGKVGNLRVRTEANQDSGGLFDTVSALMFTPNGFDLVAHDTLALVIKVRFENATVPMDRLGAIGDKSFDNSPVVQRMFNIMIETGYEGVIGSGTYLMNSQVNLDLAKGTENFQFKMRGVGYSSNYLDSDSKCNLVANAATIGALTPLIKLDLTDITQAATRFTATLTDFNITSTAGQAFIGLQVKHCWFSLERVGIKGHVNGLNSIESYRGSINKSSITGNDTGILYSGYNSVQIISDNQLRANSVRLMGFEAGYTPDPSIEPGFPERTQTNFNEFSQCEITGNNMESNPDIFDWTEAVASTHIVITGNYIEAGQDADKCINAVGARCRNIEFLGSAIGFVFAFDDAQYIDIRTNQGSLETTDKSINIEFDNDDAFSQVLGQNNKQQKQTLTTDSLLNFHSRFSLDNSSVFTPPEFRNTTVGTSSTTWELATPFYPNKKYLKYAMNGSTYVRADFVLQPLQSEMIIGIGYRVRGSITIRTNSASNIELSAKYTGGSFETAAQLGGTSGAWATYPFTIEVPFDAVDLAIRLNSGAAVDLEIDSFIVALVSNPSIQKQEEVRKVETISAGGSLVITATHSMTALFIASDSVADISITGQLGNTITITNNDVVSRQGVVIVKPTFGY